MDRGRNFCRIDLLDLRVLSDCTTVVIGNGKGGGSGGGTGAAAPLRLTSGSGLSCDSTLPTCTFQLNGTGAAMGPGLVMGEGGASPVVGSSASLQGDEWIATGVYGCTSNGALAVSIGSEIVRVPITCNS